ncbi:MAG TPA: serine hydrolase domain-containing protein [Puia sp.]|nr:serine hydrolase domain-containing protein [Puia sp.]
MKPLHCKLYLLLLLLIPLFSQSQTFLHIADSIRVTRGIPGLAYAVFTCDSTLDEGVCGFRRVKTRDSVKLYDRFNIGTNTAAFTSFIAAHLVKSGKIKWDTKLLEVFPEYKGRALPVYKNVTLADLLSNKTRIPLYSSLDDWYKLPDFTGNTMSAKRRNFTLFMLEQKPYMDNAITNELVFSYAGYVMAASMLEKVAHKKWENLVLEYINEPLKISAKFGWPIMDDTAATFGHWSQGNYFHAEDLNTWVKPSAVLYPAHNINISLPDYIRFMQEHLRGLTGKKASLDQETFQYMHFGVNDFSMGWNNGSLNDYSYSFHEGMSVLFDCRAEIIKEKGIGIIVMCNSGDRDGRGAVVNLVRLLESRYLSN